jgi:hypothetical protein
VVTLGDTPALTTRSSESNQESRNGFIAGNAKSFASFIDESTGSVMKAATSLHARQWSIGGLLGSYLSDIRNWASGIATNYAIAIGVLLVSLLCFLSATAVAISALFHWIEIHYGAAYAYAAIFGLLIAAGIAGTVAGLLLLKRETPPVPRAERQINTLKTSIAAPVLRTINGTLNSRAAHRTDPSTQLLAGTAAALLIGWVALSRGQRPKRETDD